MPRPARYLFAALVFGLVAVGATPTPAFAQGDDENRLTADSLEQPGVPRGEIVGPLTWRSEIYPGTVRDYWVYVPAQYDAEQPACVTIVQDGLGRALDWRLTTVLDNLIHQGEIPVTIGVFISPGVVPAPHDGAEARYNRSFEYDALGDRYARFLLEEILPEVGKSYRLSDDPNDRLIAGASSGAICAFNAAWERPDQFRRVFSTIGTYVGLRGGDEFVTLVRKTEPKPIRVFLQDGENDLNIYGGDWWNANQGMSRALAWAGYDVNHAWGTGGHDGRQGAAVLPQALKWLWKDHPNPVEPPVPTGARRFELLIPGEDWELVADGFGFTEGPCAGPGGEVYFTDIPANRIHRIAADGAVEVFASETGGANGLAFGPDGRLYACCNRVREIRAYDADGGFTTVASNVGSNDLVVDHTGRIFFTDPAAGAVRRIDADGEVAEVDTGVEFPNGVALSPDQTLLFVADMRGRNVYSYQIQADGSLSHKESFYHLHLPPNAVQSSADGMAVDQDGMLYVATALGVQVCDQPGRVNFIVNKPQRAWLANVAFGGPERNFLYATCGDKVFRRRVDAVGTDPSAEPVKPPRPRL